MKKYSLKRRKTKKKGGSRDILKRAKEIGAEELIKRLLYWDPNINDTEELHLYEASANNNVELVRLLLDIGADINLANRAGETPLYVASLFGYVNIVRILTERGANINKANKNGETPLHIASQNGQVEVVRILLEKGANINKFDYSSETPLYVASEAGNEEVVRILLEKGAEINKANIDGQTPLMIAVSYGHLEIMEALLEYGANINAETNEGYTAFDMVDEGPSHARSKIENLLKTYQQKNVVTKNIRDYERPNIPKTLRSLAFNNLNTEDTRIINENKLFQPGKLGGKRKTRKIKKKKKTKKNKKTRSKKQKGGDPPMTIHQAVREGLVEKVKEMIDNGRDVNQPLSNGITPLMVATHELRNGRRTRGAMRMVDMLLEKGADVNRVTALDLNVLHFAAAINNVHLIRKFIEKGVDKNKTSNEGPGETPLNIAVRNGNMDAIKALIDGGVDINHVNNNGQTAVFLVSRGFIFPLSPLLSAKILRLLIDSGANIHIESNDNYSPLWIATLNGNYNLVELLLDSGADVESFDGDGLTPLAIAAEAGKPRTAELLWKYGADIEAQDNEGNTPLMMAAKNGYEDIVEFFLEKDAYVNHENDEGLTAVDLAEREGYLEIAAMLRKHNINNEIRGYKRPNISSLGTLAYQQAPSVVDQLFNDPKRGIKRPFSQLGGKQKTRKSTNKKKNKKTRSKKKKGGRDGSINHKYNVIEKYKTEVDSENTNPFPYYNYYNNTIHELLEHENSLRRNNRAANIIRENTTEFRIIYMTLHVFLRSNTFVNGLVNENKIDDVILNIKLLIPLINESEKKRMFEFLNQKDYNIGLKLYSIRNENNRLEFPNIVKEKLDEYKNEFISTLGI